MAHTLDAVVYDVNLVVRMIVIPDDDSQLDDPAFNPLGCTHLRVPKLAAAHPGLQPGDATAQALAAVLAHHGIELTLQPPAPDAVAIGA